MKRITLFSIVFIILLSSCYNYNYNYNNIAGTYQYKYINAYHGDKVTLKLNENGSFNFEYYQSMGGYEFDGKYSIKGNKIILHPKIEMPYSTFYSCDTCSSRKITVYTPEKEIAPFANIEVFENNKTIYKTYTDTNGVAFIPLTGNYLRISYVGFEEYKFVLLGIMNNISIYLVLNQYIRKAFDGYTYIIKSTDRIIDKQDKHIHVRIGI